MSVTAAAGFEAAGVAAGLKSHGGLDVALVVNRGPSSADAAARLGWTVTKFNRKLDNVCQKLADAGIRGLHERGHTVYVECGARDALVGAVRRTVYAARLASMGFDEDVADGCQVAVSSEMPVLVRRGGRLVLVREEKARGDVA